MTKRQVQESYNNHVMNTYKRNDVAIKNGKGARALGVEGESYIDFTSGIGVNALGFCDEEWASAIAEQAKTLNHTSNLYYHEPCALLADRLSEITGLAKTFFCNSGAEANEGAIKVARKRSFDTYGRGRDRIITLHNSFHGRTITTLAATGQDVFHNYFFPFTEGFSFAEANSIKSMTSLLGKDVCGVLIELVQGEGGVVSLTKDYVQAVEAFCREHDLAFMIDEVQTGIGRTGSFFAYEQFDVKPDVVTFAKGIGGGLPLGGFIANEEYSNVLGLSDHGTTFGANPIVCAGALVVLNRVAKPEFLAKVAQKGAYTKEKLLKLPHVNSVSGLGMMIGIELGCKTTAAELAQKCHENGLMILTAKAKLRMLPPLTISLAELDEGLKILEAVLTNVD